LLSGLAAAAHLNNSPSHLKTHTYISCAVVVVKYIKLKAATRTLQTAVMTMVTAITDGAMGRTWAAELEGRGTADDVAAGEAARAAAH
jgi:hypothetical protein